MGAGMHLVFSIAVDRPAIISNSVSIADDLGDGVNDCSLLFRIA
jgi:hypothetical protein